MNNNEDKKSGLTEQTERVWECKIGFAATEDLPKGADAPMRNAVAEAFQRLTGTEAQFCFSGWGGKLTELERAVIENRLPRSAPELLATRAPADLEGLTRYDHRGCLMEPDQTGDYYLVPEVQALLANRQAGGAGIATRGRCEQDFAALFPRIGGDGTIVEVIIETESGRNVLIGEYNLTISRIISGRIGPDDYRKVEKAIAAAIDNLMLPEEGTTVFVLYESEEREGVLRDTFYRVANSYESARCRAQGGNTSVESSGSALPAEAGEQSGDWLKTFDGLLDDYVGAMQETAVFNATQRSGMTVRMAKPRLKNLMEHVRAAAPVPPVSAMAGLVKHGDVPSIEITLRQAEQLVGFFGGHDAEVSVIERPAAWANEPEGLYAYVTDYPGEGTAYLGPTEVDEDLAENGRPRTTPAAQVRNAALEEAAKLCEDDDHEFEIGARCAVAIRALRTTSADTASNGQDGGANG